jgi:hypothetical protein
MSNEVSLRLGLLNEADSVEFECDSEPRIGKETEMAHFLVVSLDLSSGTEADY